MAKPKNPPPHEQAKSEEVEALIGRHRTSDLGGADQALLERLLRLLLELVRVIEAKNVTISRLKRWLFGPGSDQRKMPAEPEPAAGTEAADESRPAADGKPKAKVRGHGRLKAAAYLGTERVECRHPGLEAGRNARPTFLSLMIPAEASPPAWHGWVVVNHPQSQTNLIPLYMTWLIRCRFQRFQHSTRRGAGTAISSRGLVLAMVVNFPATRFPFSADHLSVC